MQNIKPTPATSERLFYGWYIVGMIFIANFITAGTSFYLMNAFMEPLCDLRGWSRTEVNIAPVLATLVFLVCNLVYGTLVIRIGPRILMTLGAVVGGIAFALLGRAESLWAFYLLFMLLAMGNGAYGEMVASTAVNNWYVRKLGRAMGLATTGKSLSGAFLPLIAMTILVHYDLPRAFLVIGLFTVAMGPISWLVVRNWPEDMGLIPDGIGVNRRQKIIPTEPVDISVLEALQPKIYTLSMLVRMGTFWKLGIAFSFGLICLTGVMSQLKPRFSDIGFDHMTAMLMMSATALVGAAGKYIWGYLCERFDSRRVFAALMATCAVGLSLGLLRDSLVALILFIIIFGFGIGGTLSAFFVLIADFFGRRAFPSVLRYITVFNILQLSGFIIAGQSYDRFGSYDAAYGVFIVCNILAALLILTAKRPRTETGEGPPEPISQGDSL